MAATYQYQPDYAVPPGSLLKEYLAERGLSNTEFARRCGRSAKLIGEIVAGKAPVEPATALQFERVLGMDARIWLGIEANFQRHQGRTAEVKDNEATAWAKRPPMRDLRQMPVSELLSLNAATTKELRDREVLRSANNPVADFAEYMFCSTFGWKQAPPSEKGYDATDRNGRRFQIKGRRIISSNKSRQLSAIRSFDTFDLLAVLLFSEDYRVHRAALMPNEIVKSKSRFQSRTRSFIFEARDDVWGISDVVDVTSQLRKQWDKLP